MQFEERLADLVESLHTFQLSYLTGDDLVSEKKPQSFRADPIFLARLREQASRYGLSMSDLVVRYIKVAYKLHEKYPDILGLGAPINLNDIPENDVRVAASQALFSRDLPQQDTVTEAMVRIKENRDNYENILKKSFEEQKKVFQETIEEQKKSFQKIVEEQKRVFQEAMDGRMPPKAEDHLN